MRSLSLCELTAPKCHSGLCVRGTALRIIAGRTEKGLVGILWQHPRRLEEACRAFYAPQPHMLGLPVRTSAARSIAVESWTCVSVGSEPRYYAESQLH